MANRVIGDLGLGSQQWERRGGPACLNREGTGVDVDRDIEETVDPNEWAIAINKGLCH